jgi:hypothetical protein
MAKTKKRTPQRRAKRPVGQSRRRERAHAVKLQVVKIRQHRGTGYRWQTMRASGGRGTPIAVSGNTFKTARSAAYNGRNMNPHLKVTKVEFL